MRPRARREDGAEGPGGGPAGHTKSVLGQLEGVVREGATVCLNVFLVGTRNEESDFTYTCVCLRLIEILGS